MPNPYDNCPCGSGKKFKWCCTSYWDNVELAFKMHEDGQHENSIRVLETLVKEHATVPQVWGYAANILMMEGQGEKAEEYLAKALELQPTFAMAYLLKASLRQAEGEVIGALMLYRKAAENYSPEAVEQLAQVYETIARHELMLNHTVASRYALEQAQKAMPNDADLQNFVEAFFGEDSRIPKSAGKGYTYRATIQPVTAPAKLSEAKKTFEEASKSASSDPAVWFNLGLTLAWLGENGPAADALNKSIELEYSDANAEETAALVEVLKCGHGMEADSDYIEHRSFLPIRDPNAIMQLLQAWDQERRIVAPQTDERRMMFSCMLVEPLPNLLDTGTTMAKVVANVTIADGVIRLWHVNKDSVQKIAQEIRDRLALAVEAPTEGTGLVAFSELVQEAFCYPISMTQIEEAEKKLRDHATNYFETIWANKPMKVFGGATPIDAAGSSLMRKRLLGVVKFIEDCTRSTAPRKGKGKNNEESEVMDVYDFARLRHKLGAELKASDGPPAALIATAKVQAKVAKRDFTAMNAADLAGLPMADLSAAEAEDAMRAALKLDARELAVAFAKAGVSKPADPAKPDRYPMYACAITGLATEGKFDDAIQYAKDGAAFDQSNNSGKRANEFGLRTAQLLAKSGKAGDAATVFHDLINRNPDEPKYYVAALETMVSARQKDKALEFANLGLSKAQSSGNRDLEGACKELGEAAKRIK